MDLTVLNVNLPNIYQDGYLRHHFMWVASIIDVMIKYSHVHMCTIKTNWCTVLARHASNHECMYLPSPW